MNFIWHKLHTTRT